MKSTIPVVCIAFCSDALAAERAAAAVPDLDALPLPNIYSSKTTYKVDPYIAAAAKLQSLGKEEALRHLADFALDNRHAMIDGNAGWRAEPLYVLCRMLFVPREGIPFRAPALGVGGDPKLNPLEPIEIVDGIPFLTFQGRYLLTGAPEEPTTYLLFCITHCNWSDYRYAPKTMAKKRAALEKLLAHRADDYTADNLRTQIESR
jgi:hypothetical protein